MTTKQINDFIVQVNAASELFNKVHQDIFTDKINDKLFNKTCNKKFSLLKKNNIYLILIAIISYQRKSCSNEVIIKSIEKCILYYLFMKDLDKNNNKDVYDQFKINNYIHQDAGGNFIDSIAKKILDKPDLISEKITENNMRELLQYLINDNTITYEKKKKDKRRTRKFFEKSLFFYFYKQVVPTEKLKNSFSLEHVFPFSSRWDGRIDIDRLGNLFPLISQINNKRGTKHISQYQILDREYDFIKYVEKVIVTNTEYNTVVEYQGKVPYIIDNSFFDQLCQKNETIYIDYFIKHLF